MASGNTTAKTNVYRERLSFAKIPEVMDIPNLFYFLMDSPQKPAYPRAAKVCLRAVGWCKFINVHARSQCFVGPFVGYERMVVLRRDYL